ncbi:MAG: DoxX family protein [Acidobacteriaceae bacterium]
MTNNSRMAKSSGSGAGDFGLLVLRVALGATLFWKHGIEKVTHFSQMSSHFPNPIHIGSHWSLVYALISDAICSVLVALGLATRAASLIIVVNLAVVFYFIFHMSLQHGELVLIYLAGFIALLFTGAGRFSLDWKVWGRS